MVNVVSTDKKVLLQSESKVFICSPQGFVNIYLLAVLVLLPIDWFSPTGLLFREFGAKPVSILLTIGGIFGLFIVRGLPVAIRVFEYSVLLVIGVFILLGCFGFFINLTLDWSAWDYSRNPTIQFLSQLLLIAASAVSVLGNARLCWHFDFVSKLKRLFFWSAALHLTLFLLESIDKYESLFLLFRTEGGLIDRPSGLMSEPSYYGTFAALFGLTLITIRDRGGKRLVNLALAIALYATAISVGAKTLVVVAGAQALFLVLRSGVGLQARIKNFLALVLVCAAAYIFVEQFSTLDVGQNMSSAMRFGSTLLALNASSAGFAATGIGIGQFHFFYRDEFAPEFLFNSFEALNQLSPDAQSRASAFNLYARILLEFGFIGFIIFLRGIIFFLRTKISPKYQFIKLFFVGSLGFLMTQDTYYYPPLVFAMALILGLRYAYMVDIKPC